MRSRLYLTQHETPNRDSAIRVLTTVKANYGRAGERIYLKRRGGVFVALGGDELPAAGTRVKNVRQA